MNQKEIIHWLQNSPLAGIYKIVSASSEEDPAHDISHLLRVAYWTDKLTAGKVPREESAAAALLHDFVNIPKNHPDRALASEQSALAAKPLLEEAGFAPLAIERICLAIKEHSFSRGATPQDILGKALQDADRLEALGAIGLMRVISTGNKMGAKYFHATDPWAKKRELDDLKFSVDHFFTKLLKLPSTFLTEEGKAEALRRATILENFLNNLGEEIGEPL